MVNKGLNSGSQPGLVLPPRGHWAMSGDIFGVTSGQGCHWRLVREGRDAVKHPTMHRSTKVSVVLKETLEHTTTQSCVSAGRPVWIPWVWLGKHAVFSKAFLEILMVGKPCSRSLKMPHKVLF